MKKLIVVSLLFLFMLQCSMRTLILVSFYFQRDAITAQFCMNKNKPQLCCKGKCYLQKKIIAHEKNESQFPEIFKNETACYIATALPATIPQYTIDVLGANTPYLLKIYTAQLSPPFQPPSLFQFIE